MREVPHALICDDLCKSPGFVISLFSLHAQPADTACFRWKSVASTFCRDPPGLTLPTYGPPHQVHGYPPLFFFFFSLSSPWENLESLFLLNNEGSLNVWKNISLYTTLRIKPGKILLSCLSYAVTKGERSNMLIPSLKSEFMRQFSCRMIRKQRRNKTISKGLRIDEPPVSPPLWLYEATTFDTTFSHRAINDEAFRISNVVTKAPSSTRSQFRTSTAAKESMP